jgi:XTP/dITP diphosphohydrolase
MRRLIVATGNAHKVEEFVSLLPGCGFEVVSAKVCGGMPDVIEDGDSFSANAAIKARVLKAIAPAEAWVVSDDSGLEVDALDGAPGIYSARYAGESMADGENLRKLLVELEGVPVAERSGCFRCVLCLISSEGVEYYFDGACEGTIATEATGDHGFGYDPVFVPNGYNQSFAELGDSVKSRLSHRALAVEKMRAFLKKA